MRLRVKIAIIVSIVCSGLLLSTLILPGKEQVEVSFSTLSGQKGTVQFSVPTQVYAGDRVNLSALVTFSNEMHGLDNTHATGRLEAGFDEIQPAGETRLNLSFATPVEFEWWIRTAREATYQGTLWLWLEVEGTRELLLAREFVLESNSYLGWRVRPLRVLFACVVGISILLVTFDFLRNFQRSRK